MTEGGWLPDRRRREDLPEPDFARVFDVAPAPFLLLTPDFVIVHANRARLAATSTTLAENVGRHLFELFPQNPDDPAADGIANMAASLALARDTKQPVTMPIQKHDIRLPDGTYVARFWAPWNVPVLDDDGEVVLLLHRSDDITAYVDDREAARREVAHEQHRADQVESDLFVRTRELERLNARLRGTNERERRTAQQLAGLAATVSALAAADTVDELVQLMFERSEASLGARATNVSLLGPDRRSLALHDSVGSELATGTFGDLTVGSPLPMAVAATGRAVFVGDADREGPTDPHSQQVRAALGVRSWAALPLRSGGRLLGSWTVGWTGPSVFDGDTVRVLEAYAAQCAQALDRVGRLVEERRRASATRTLAETLQRSLLTDPPQVAHLRINVRYRPAAAEAQVGGDWYDAFLSPDGATTLAVGDVTGHDWTAAAVMGQVRNLLRGVAHALDAPPATTLTALDRAMRDLDVGTLATALLARVEQPAGSADSSARVLRWSCAGHLPPLLVRANGRAQLLRREVDLLLGVDPSTRRRDHEVTLLPGDTVVLYTDGLVERRDATLDDGLARLVAAGRGLATVPVEEVCDRLMAGMAPDLADDIALVTLRVEA
ncbi:SpoIIE family protein phosphatase [Modestobacter sp. NPDC049651]|uniref:SpoIIE family protein phosphatase n=1 Tax=unclassified Modestobacter TaxID=2643866 RepID=UPI0033EAB5C3